VSTDDDAARRVAESFARQDFMASLGARLTSVGVGQVTITLDVRPGLLQQHGFVHAGVVSAIADSAAGYAALSLLPAGTDVVTAEFKINLLAPARGAQLIARARVVRSGRTLSVCTSEVFAVDAGAEKQIALLVSTVFTMRGAT
jgi:uncharacterized protein (TIGR00369 family)